MQRPSTSKQVHFRLPPDAYADEPTYDVPYVWIQEARQRYLHPSLQQAISQHQIAPPQRTHEFVLQEQKQLATCNVCGELILGRALNCEDCNLLCHINCERKVVSVCPGNADSRKKTQGPTNHSTTAYRETGTSLRNSQIKMSSGTGNKESAEIEILFVTERILVLTFPHHGSDMSYRQSLKEVSRMLKTKHANKYKIFNVSKRRHDLTKLNSSVVEYGWPDELAPPLERLCSLCKEIEHWLHANAQNVVVVHSKGGRSRPAVVIAAYLHYNNICASEDQALDRFAMKRFYDEHIAGISQPSQKRYLQYFSGLLSGAIKINSSAIYLHYVRVIGLPPNESKGLHPFMKIYEKMEPVYTSPIFTPLQAELMVYLDHPLMLRGDILIKCYNRKSNFPPSREVLFRCQFNTCALQFQTSSKSLVFQKQDLDEACQGSGFPDSMRVEFLFSLTPDQVKNGLPADQSIEYDSQSSEIVRSDSYENFNAGAEDEDFALDSVVDLLPAGPDKSRSDTITSDGYSFDLGPREPLIVERVAAAAAVDSKPKGNDSTDSGISTGSYGHTARQLGFQNQEVSPDAVEPPCVKSEKKGALDSTKDQFIKLFGRTSPSPEPESDYAKIQKDRKQVTQKVYKPNEAAKEVTMEASVKSADVRKNSPPPSDKPAATKNNPLEFLHRPPPVTPPSKRPVSPLNSLFHTLSRPTSPPHDPSLIDVGLVGKDRYDTQSKAFSYAPASELKDHFSKPKKPTMLVQKIDGFPGKASPYPDVWTDTEPEYTSIQPARKAHSTSNGHTMERLEQDFPEIKESGPTRAKVVRYRSVDEMSDIHSPEVDELLDPNFYLNYSSGSPLTSTTQTKPVVSNRPSAAPGTMMTLQTRTPSPKPDVPPPPKHYEPSPSPVMVIDLDQNLLHGEHEPSPPAPPRPPAPAMTPEPPPVPPKPKTSTQALYRPPTAPPGGPLFNESYHTDSIYQVPPKSAPATARSHYSDWNLLDSLGSVMNGHQSRSVGGTPKRHTLANGRGRSASTLSDMDPDDWLDMQLQRLRVKREVNDTGMQKRRQQEKMLLEELKHIHEEREQARSRRESDYSLEGVGTKMEDPNQEPKREQERSAASKMSASEINELMPRAAPKKASGRTMSDLSYDRHGPVTGKPPTPPPRERSRTPPSPRRMSPITVQPKPKPVPQPVPQPVQSPTTFDQLESLLLDEERTIRATPTTARRQPPSPAPYGPTQSFAPTVSYASTPQQSSSYAQTAQYSPKPILKRSQNEVFVPNGPVAPSECALETTKDTRALLQSRRMAMTQMQMLHDLEVLLHELDVQHTGVAALGQSRGADDLPQTPLHHVDGRIYQTPREQPASSFEYDPNRPQTPAFPVRGGRETPLPYHPLLYAGADNTREPRSPGTVPRTPMTPREMPRSPSPGSLYYGQSRRSSVTSMGEPMEVIHHHPVFLKDTSKYWYKPNLSREETINILRDKPPGTFIIRDSNSFPGAFGLALKVAQPPPGVEAKSADGSELVRHFLIEPTSKGVKLKGCQNEPVFGSLSALVYQHSITPLALPCKLLLPDFDPAGPADQSSSSAVALLEQGAACNVIYIYSCDTESLTGPEAVRRAVEQALRLAQQGKVAPVSVHFKVSSQGVTITDNTRKLFFRRHYPVHAVTFCGLDPDDRRWNQRLSNSSTPQPVRLFGFVARKIASRTDNACHIFAELEPEQPATAIVNFVTKVMMAQMPRR